MVFLNIEGIYNNLKNENLVYLLFSIKNIFDWEIIKIVENV